ncbi:hypothetical protein QUV83_12695 [Cellulomonas cellasea]|uniref:hypothetical protein n=1 Tax=Cellulomonas cellasea TaxID=43670 RepID=UPI0025A3ECA2|nr:hypothetical protein [Cellulomonas cellasea]MDM8085626.1 hypothetical protein [Cellulomonas cellasea]
MSTQGHDHEGDDKTRAEDTDVLGLFDPPAAATSAPTSEPTSEPASSTTPLPPTPPGPAGPYSSTAPAAAPAPRPEREFAPMRVGTVVWGLILAAVGFGVVATASGAEIDMQLALISLMGIGGLALLVGSVVTARRRRD